MKSPRIVKTCTALGEVKLLKVKYTETSSSYIRHESKAVPHPNLTNIK